nr:hypothetical protein [Tanacetum cinerariifolium]
MLFHTTHGYLNVSFSPKIDTYRAKFKSEFPNKDMKEESSGWFGKRIRQRHVDSDPGVSKSSELFALACGPSQTPISVNSCVVNGARFVLDSRDERRTTQNSSICSPCPDGEINNITQIKSNGKAFKNDQYILATQFKQCFYLEDMAKRPLGWKVVKHVSHKKFLNGGVVVVKDNPDVIHVDNSSDLALFTSLNGLEIVALHIDGQSIDVDAPSDIIDVVDEGDDIIDEKDPVPHDLADSDDEDLVNLDIYDGVNMSADVARGHGSENGGDDRPPPYEIPTGRGGSCRCTTLLSAKCCRSERRRSWQRLGLPSLPTWNLIAYHKSIRPSNIICKSSTMARRLLSTKGIGFLKRTRLTTWSASDADVPRTFSSTIPKTESNEVIKSSVENLVPIPSEFEGIFDDTCDVPFCDNSPPLDVLNDHFKLFSDFNDDCTSSDDDSFKDIDYVEASPPDYELVSLEEVKDDILREKLLNINLLIAKFESSNDNPTLDCVLKSPSLFPIPVEDSDSFFEKFDTSLSYSDNSLPEFETFSDHTKETSNDSTTTAVDNSLPEYDSFHFEIELDQGELTSVVTEDILGEPYVHVPNVLPTHPTLMLNSDFIPSNDSLGSDLEVSFPFGTRNKIFDPGIFFEVQSKIFLSRGTFSISFILNLLCPLSETLFPFSSENEDKVFNPGILSSNLLSHRGKITFDFSESPIMIFGGDIPFLDDLFLHFYPP